MQKNRLIAPSTEKAQSLAELLKYEKELSACADWLHCDIMDGIFVERQLFSKHELIELAKVATLPLDFHLMCEFISDESLLDFYISLKPFNISIHIEGFKNHDSLLTGLRKIKKAGIKACLVVKVETSIEEIERYINEIDMILIMSVPIGYGGQKFSLATLEKILKAREIISKANKKVLLQVDGGITDQISNRLFEMGVDCLVSGSFIFNSENRCEAIKTLKK